MLLCGDSSRWYLPSEVVIHNTPNDLWVIVNYFVYDLSYLIKQEKDNKEILPLLAFGGKDISWWFNSEKKFKSSIDPKTGKEVPYMPYGQVLHVFEYFYRNQLSIPNFIPWWRDKKYVIGRLTKNPRPIKILNTLSDETTPLSVCEEESILEIAERYKRYNLLCLEYTWYYLDKKLAMCDNLKDNGIFDQRDLFWQLNLPHDFFVPTLHLIYSDSCTSDICGVVQTYHNLAKIDFDCIKAECIKD